MTRAVLTYVMLTMFASLAVAVVAEPTVSIYTDAETYYYGDTIEVSLAALNVGDGMSVDVYVGLLTPDGGLYTLSPYGMSGWSANVEAWIPDIYLPSEFSMHYTPFFWFDVPCSTPPIGDQGEYSFAALLTRVGSFDEWVCNVSLARFTVVASPVSHYYVDAQSGDDSNDGSADSPWKTITHGLASALNTPATIHVTAGTYTSSTNGETFPLNMKSYVSLIGDSPEKTILDAEGDSRLILCDNVNNLTIQGFTITGGRADDCGGAGIYCLLSSPTISNNTISGNFGRWGGGGIYCLHSSPTISNNTISDNSAHSDGGAIDCYDSSPTIENNTIIGNTAYVGGGIECYESSPTIMNNTISDNSADYGGGGIYCSGYYSPTITSNSILDNSAYNGGGICCGDDSCPTITNNTISGNSAYNGGGIYSIWYSWPTIIDCIIWNNRDDLYGCSATYCCIEDNDSGTGNIHYDPMFVEGPFGDHYLHPDSLCIDAGSQSTEEAGLSDRTTQADSTPDTGTVDMGYHYPIP